MHDKQSESEHSSLIRLARDEAFRELAWKVFRMMVASVKSDADDIDWNMDLDHIQSDLTRMLHKTNFMNEILTCLEPYLKRNTESR